MNTLASESSPACKPEDGPLHLLTWTQHAELASSAVEHSMRNAAQIRPTLAKPSMMSALLSATSAGQRRHALQQAMRLIGFEVLNITLAESMNGALVPVSSLGGLPDASWADLYLRDKHHEVDPRLQDVAGSGLPCVWDIDSLHADTLRRSPRDHAEDFIRDLRSTACRSGVLFALRGGMGSGRSLVGLCSIRQGRAWMTEEVVGQALMLAVFALEHSGDIAPFAPPEIEARSLSELQRGILLCLRQGMGDKTIADRLGLTTHNVDYHLRKLRQRFGARNRVQLVQAAQGAMSG